jgi:TRAP-type C4-dicarboxylate transport system substrate-binding protein
LSRGVVDMTLNNWGFVGDFKIDEVSSQHLDLPLGAVAVGIVMRKDRFDSLPPEARAAIEGASGEALARKLGQAFDRQEKDVRARISASGKNTVVTPSEAELVEWRKVIDPVNSAWRKAKPRNEAIYKAFTGHLERIRAGS